MIHQPLQLMLFMQKTFIICVLHCLHALKPGRSRKPRDIAQDRCKRGCNLKVRSTLIFKLGKMVCIDKPPLNASSPGNSYTLATASNNKLMPKAMWLFAIDSVKPNMLAIAEHVNYNTTQIDRVGLAHGKRITYQCVSALSSRGRPSNIPWCKQAKHWTVPIEYPVDRVVSHEGSENDLFYLIFCHENLPEHNTLETAKHLPQQFIHCFRKEKPRSDNRKWKWSHIQKSLASITNNLIRR